MLMYVMRQMYLGTLVNLKKIPVGARFFAHVQTGPGAHPARYTMGTRSFPGVKSSGRGVDHLLPSVVEVENE
jgi:hypothetical protein